jgi:hypothetical protein
MKIENTKTMYHFLSYFLLEHKFCIILHDKTKETKNKTQNEMKRKEKTENDSMRARK